MRRRRFFGVQIQIAVALALVLILFIAVTEATISKLTRVAVARQTTDSVASVDGPLPNGKADSENLLTLRRLVLFYLAAGAAMVLMISALTLNRKVIRPLGALSRALSRVGEGRLDTQMPLDGAREFVEIGGAFNRMTKQLALQKGALEEQLQHIAEANQALRETQDRLIRAAKLASVGTLAAGVAHEIGNPLAGLLGLLEALERGVNKSEEAQYLALMKSEIQRIDRIIGNLLSFARAPKQAEQGAQRASLREVVDRIRPLLRAQRLFDRVIIEERVEEVDAAVSPDDLTQILLNLLMNAAEAMAGHGTIEIETECLDKWERMNSVSLSAVRIHVTDDGPGIDEATAAKIFDPFFTKKGPGEGTGLGLSICHNLCERAGGEIIFDSLYKAGTRFTVILPRA